MVLQSRVTLDQELAKLRDNTVRLVSMVDKAIMASIDALMRRDVSLAKEIIGEDEAINLLRYQIEEESLRVLATQQPAASDLRQVVATLHVAGELERMGDHAAGIAQLVEYMEEEPQIDSFHQLPKMAKRARQMVQECVDAYAQQDVAKAWDIIRRDDKLDKHYRKLFDETIREMRDDSYIHRATYLLWAGHNLERIGDRATNIAERVIFMTTGQYVEIAAYTPDSQET